MSKNYNIALDIGTNSVGWSVIDNDYNLIRYKKRNMWGVRLFESGKTAEERRGFRSTRRRMQRRKNRISLLRQIMGEEVLEKDNLFFIRMNEAFLHRHDRTDKINKSNLFVGKDFNDKAYYKKYKTIYHLRQKLIESEEREDIRLVYLAIHHIIKYRGNFLYEGQRFEDITSDIKNTFENLLTELSDREILNFSISEDNILKILKNKILSRKKKVEELCKLYQGAKLNKNKVQHLFQGIVGLKFDIKKLFEIDSLENDKQISFGDNDIEEKLTKIEEVLCEDYIIIELMKKIYNWVTLQGVLQGESNISAAMIENYRQYESDLKNLKLIIKDNFDLKTYRELFKSKIEKQGNYYNYSNDLSGKTDYKELFYKRINSLLKDSEISEKYEKEKNSILHRIQENDFLVKQNTISNSAIPYQLNENELDVILQKQGKYYPILKQKKNEILKLLKFRIPYYVGPLNPNSNFSWIEKLKGKENEKIYPWNFEDVVDLHKSAEKFIEKMTNQCTYLPQYTVIAKNSLLYSDYIFYNEINKVRVNGELIDVNTKEKLRNQLFLNKKNITENDLINWFKNNQFFKSQEYKIEGLQGENKATSSLGVYKDFKEILGYIDENNRDMIEEIIYWITIFEDKKLINQKIMTKYPQITNKQRERIIKLNYKGWGRLSKELLNGIYIEDSFGFKTTIIKKLKTTNMNFMQIINDERLGYNKKIKEAKNLEEISKISYDDHIKVLQGSPAIKRGIWQSVKLVEEIIKIMTCKPDNIYIEFARSDEESKRTQSRKSKLIKLYKDIADNVEVSKELNKKDLKLDNDRKYLYFIQQGKCMYTGEPLNFDSLHLYELDHIIPQSYIKDNSIENVVLVKKKMNQEKSDNKLPALMVSNTIKEWWGILNKHGLIGNKKYRNLMRTTAFNEYEEKGFINRQLVEVRQISMHVTELFNKCYGKDGTKIVAIKADLVDNFRKHLGIYKNREVNDYHHAKDAFIVGVIGYYIMSRFPNMNSEFIYDEFLKYKKKNTEKNKYGFIISSMNYEYKNSFEKVVWSGEKSKEKVKNILNYKDCNITKRTTFNTGQMFNANASKKVENINNKTPIKKNLDICKYGYYDGEQQSYYTIISHVRKNKTVKELIGIPIRIASIVGDSKEKLEEYLAIKGYMNVKIIKNKVPKYQQFRNDKGIFYLASSSEWHNAKQLILDNKYDELIHKICSEKLWSKDEHLETQLVDFYKYFIDKLESQYLIFGGIANKLKGKTNEFDRLQLQEKTLIIKELLKITKTNAETALLSKIKAGDRQGRLNEKTINIDKSTFIYQSVTGLFVKECNY